MDGIVNTLVFLNESWLNILVIVFLIWCLIKKTKDFIMKTDEEKKKIAEKQIEQIKKQIMEIMLSLTTEEEIKYSEWVKAGSIKRAEVIKKIYEMYPALETVANQEELTKFIDKQIDESLKTLRAVMQTQVENAIAIE